MLAAAAVLLPAAGAAPDADRPRPPPAPAYVAPVPGEVWRGFEPPGTAYGPGHRGVDLAAEPGDPVAAAARGVVVHAGPVAGTTWVSIDHPDGIRTAYGPLTRLRVGVGQRVDGGEAVGRLAPGGHGHRGRDRGLHLSARRHGTYLDPLALLDRGSRPSLSGCGQTPAPAAPGTGQRPAAPTVAAESTDDQATVTRPGRAARPGRPRVTDGRWTP